MKLQRMRFSNDCSVASVSMVLRRPYEEVLKVAIANKFNPDSPVGIDVYSLLHYCGYDCSCRIYIRALGLRPIPMKQPIIVSIPSLNNYKGRHAVVIQQGRVYDPSNRRRASFNYVTRNRGHMYYNFRKETI